MKKDYTISALAIISLIIIQTFYLINLYNDYCYRYVVNIDEQVYKAIDKEELKRSSIVYNIDYNKLIRQLVVIPISGHFT